MDQGNLRIFGLYVYFNRFKESRANFLQHRKEDRMAGIF